MANAAGHLAHAAQALHGDKPNWLKCRLQECGDCGWRHKYPTCETIKSMQEQVSFRPLDSARRYIEWMGNGCVGDPPARKASGKVDQLALVAAPTKVRAPHIRSEY